MEGENPNHGRHQHQSEEAARDAAPNPWEEAARARAAADPWREEEVVAAEEDGAAGADQVVDLDLDAAIAQDEAMAHAMYMEELMQVEDWDLRRFQLEDPQLPAGAEGPAAADHAAPAGQPVHHQYAGGLRIFDSSAAAAAALDNANRVVLTLPAGGDIDMLELANHVAAMENQQLFAAAEDNATNNQLPAPARCGPRAFNQTTTRHVGGGIESVTVRLETRKNREDAVISARQALLGDGSSPVVLAGMEEEEHNNSWYESISREAQRMEQMEEPAGLYEVSYFQTQLPSPQQEPIEGLGFLASDDLDLDEPGPSTVRPARVPPLADDELPMFTCGICMETLPILDLFHGTQCEHRFCVECMATYIEGRIRAGEVPIPCPACRELGGEDDSRLVLHPEECKKSIDFAAFGSWGDRLTESAIPQNRRAYCPNRQCGVMLEATGGKTPVMAFCPACSHPMCATCGMEWSKDDSGQHDCTEGPSATLVKKLAEERRWKQCPRCKMLVEKIYGCDTMQCRCKFVFCYACGLPTGRQEGMEEGAELCHGHNIFPAAEGHAHQHQ